MKFGTWLALTLSLVFLISCSDDEKQSLNIQNGVFVVNEGNFTKGNGTISFWDKGNSTTLNLFGVANNKKALGDVVQSMSIHDGKAYIIVNNDNKLEIVNENTFQSVHTLKDLKMPRYFTTLDNVGYLTEWVSFDQRGRVSIIDLESHEITGTITTDYGAENIMAYNDLLYVSNSSSNTVSVIDPAQEEVIKTIEVGDSPGELLIDNDNKLWVVCGGGYDETWSPLNNGALVQIDPTKSNDSEASSVLKTIELGMNISAKAVIDVSNNNIYYYKTKSVYKINTTATEAPAEPLFTATDAVSLYGIGLDKEESVLYLADDKGFTGNGAALTYELDGTFITSFETGIGPNGFIFK